MALSPSTAIHCDLLNSNDLYSSLQKIFPNLCFTLQIFPSIDSTNCYLLEKNPENVYICLAEQQTAGRGRQGKTWVSPFGVNLYCSVLWPFKQSIAKLTGLSLMVGVVVAKTLEDYGVSPVGLKWPNDIYIQPNQKIAGILIETLSEPKNRHKTVIGIGLNISLSRVLNQYNAAINQPWTDVESIVNFPPNRTQLALLLLKNLLNALPLFEKNGFSAFQAAWLNKDVMLNQPVTLQASGKTCEGIARGVDEIGRLIVENIDGFNYFSSAETLRKTT